MAETRQPEPADKVAHAGHDKGTTRSGEEEHLRGIVTRVAGTALTVILEKGSSVVVLTDKQTDFERGGKKTSLKGVKTGERIVIYATPNHGKWLARVVKLSAPTPSAKAADAGTVPAPHDHGAEAPASKNAPQAQEFSCPMHPEVRSATQSRCPKCGMKLQPAQAAK